MTHREKRLYDISRTYRGRSRLFDPPWTYRSQYAQQDRHAVAPGVRDSQVCTSIAVEIACHRRAWAGADSVGNRRLQRAVPIAKQHANRTVGIVYGDHV